MTVLIGPDALRAARALSSLNQRDVAERLHMSKKAIAACETEDGALISANVRLRSFYEGLGLEFLGTANLATNEIFGSGVRWRTPPVGNLSMPTAEAFHTENFRVALRAARSLMGVDQIDISRRTGISYRRVAALEDGSTSPAKVYLQLRNFYEDQGVEFLVGEESADRTYYGIGVRWQTLR